MLAPFDESLQSVDFGNTQADSEISTMLTYIQDFRRLVDSEIEHVHDSENVKSTNAFCKIKSFKVSQYVWKPCVEKENMCF